MQVILIKAVGIDLGTTNSAVGLMNPADSDVILHRDQEQRETMPSCVWRDPAGGKIVVGHKAFARCGTLPTPARSFKILMGKTSWLFLVADLLDLPSLVNKLQKRNREVDRWLADQLSKAPKTVLEWYGKLGPDHTNLPQSLLLDLHKLVCDPAFQACFANIKLRKETETLLREAPQEVGLRRLIRVLLEDVIVHHLNTIVGSPSVCADCRFPDVQLREETKILLQKQPTGEDLLCLNRMLLEDAYPVELLRRRLKIDLGGGCEMSPEELSAEVLKEMKRQIEDDARKLSSGDAVWTINRAIVTVPAYFDQPQVAATMRAAQLAGLELLELLHEPTAAATYYCWRTGTRDGAFMVFDLGGGTFDVTILKVTAGAFSVLGLSGHTQLGGDNLDTAIAEGMLQRLQEDGYALDLDLKNPEDKLRFDLLKFLAEGVKKRLSDAQEYVLRDSSTLQDKNARAVIFNTLFERRDVAGWMKPAVERTIGYCWQALEAAEKRGLKLADIDQIILAGGSTHIPAVQERVRREFCSLSPSEWTEYRAECIREGRTVSPPEARAKCQKPVYEKVDTIVALGAAIRAAAIGGLHLTDSEKTMRVEVRGVAVTDRTIMQVDGHVKSLGGVSLDGASICLYVPEPPYEEEVKLGADGHFFFDGVPMTPQGEVVLNFEILGGDGQCLAVVARTMRGGKSVIPGGTTVVLPKAISMDVTRDSVKERLVLISEGASLPAKANFVLRHPGQTNQIRFVLYQRRRLIKEVVVPVPSSLPKGTPINLTINVDEFSFITMQGKVGDVPFDAPIEPPPPRDLPTAAEVEAQEQSFKEGLAYLDEGRRMPKRARFTQTMKAYKDALTRNDRNQAIHEIEELEDLVASVARVAVVLQPPKTVFDKRVTETMGLVQEGRGILQRKNQDTTPVQDWVARVEAQRDVGERAYRDGKQADLADAIQQLTDLKSYIFSVLRPFVDIPEFSLEERAGMKLDRCTNDLDEVRQGAEAARKHTALEKARMLKEELDTIGPMASKDPQAAVGRLSTIHQQIQQLARELSVKVPPDLPEQ